MTKIDASDLDDIATYINLALYFFPDRNCLFYDGGRCCAGMGVGGWGEVIPPCAPPPTPITYHTLLRGSREFSLYLFLYLYLFSFLSTISTPFPSVFLMVSLFLVLTPFSICISPLFWPRDGVLTQGERVTWKRERKGNDNY